MIGNTNFINPRKITIFKINYQTTFIIAFSLPFFFFIIFFFCFFIFFGLFLYRTMICNFFSQEKLDNSAYSPNDGIFHLVRTLSASSLTIGSHVHLLSVLGKPLSFFHK